MTRISYASTLQFFKMLNTINKISKLHSRTKHLTTNLKNKGGRLKGQIITPRRGIFIKRIYRYIDFKRYILPEYKGIILKTLYDPNRSSNLCQICFPVGVISYIIQPSKIIVGDVIINNTTLPKNYVDSASLLNIHSGSLIHNLQGRFTKSAGCSTILVRKDYDQALIKLKS